MIFYCCGEVGKWQKEEEWMDDGNNADITIASY